MENPYNFQVQEYSQIPEDIAIEILSGSDASDISDIPIDVINGWLQQEKELWHFTDAEVPSRNGEEWEWGYKLDVHE
tara:strand:- start:465 stop:695 length:231 start_codon:yes stop_codon:yes gene_type:complete